MILPRHARRTVLVLLWAYALWYAWACCGLSGDGSYFLLENVRQQGFLPYDFYPSRAFVNFAAQTPVVAALQAGVTDLHWLARLSSFGWIAFPAALYSLALLRAGEDAVVLAIAIAGLAVVFMTTSFLAVAEHIPAYALAMLAGVWLATTRRLEIADGLVLSIIAFVSMRAYEAFVYLGPLLAAQTLWTIYRTPTRPWGQALPYLAAAGMFLAAGWIAGCAIIGFDDHAYVGASLGETRSFWRNLQLVLAFGAASLLGAWALLRPRDLAGVKPYLAAGVPVLLLALTPLLVLADRVVFPPYAYQQQAARLAAGPIVAVFVVVLWMRSLPATWRPVCFMVLEAAQPARRLLAFACVLFGATLPWNLMLSGLYVAYLDRLQVAILANAGSVSFERSGLPEHRRLLQGDGFTLPILSRLLGREAGTGIVMPPRGYDGWRPFPPEELPALDGYAWR